VAEHQQLLQASTKPFVAELFAPEPVCSTDQLPQSSDNFTYLFNRKQRWA